MARAATATAMARRGPDALAIAAVFALACALVRARGFDHVSDDDFARVTIAQAFAHGPRLDPSGTSWLPFPFWILGTAMALVGRSLAAARTLSIVFAALAAPLPYLAMRATGSSRRAALGGTLLALATPWALWLGASTVPEPFTASLTAAAAIVVASRSASVRARALGALAMTAACLSRYEPWPVAATLALALLLEAATSTRRRAPLALAAVVMAAPIAWMLWNAHAHGSAIHFLERVARYRRAVGQGAGSDLVAAVLLYPRRWVTTRPELLFALGVTLVFARPAGRARWAVPLACVLAQLAFLAYGAVKDGAPTHHAERALLAAFTLVACGVADCADLMASARAGARSATAGLALLAFGLAGLDLRRLREPPGTTPWEDRTAQIARGHELRDEPELTLTPCAYEHFALIAAYGAPERVTVLARSGEDPSAACPRITSPAR